MKPQEFIAGLALILLLAACRPQQIAATDIQLELSVSDRRVGETTLLVTVKDKAGKPIADPGSLSVRGDMTHAGMAPVFGEAEKALDGVFALPFEWTMAGGWTLEATLRLKNGAVAARTFNFEILREASMAGTGSMDHSGMTGETSAVYMRITNRGERDITLVSAASSAAAGVEFHRTVIEDDIARMEALDGLVIPAGETIDLRPGGAHIMLRGLLGDLLPQSQMPLQLVCDSGALYDLDIPVRAMLMDARGRCCRNRGFGLQHALGAPGERGQQGGCRHDQERVAFRLSHDYYPTGGNRRSSLARI